LGFEEGFFKMSDVVLFPVLLCSEKSSFSRISFTDFSADSREVWVLTKLPLTSSSVCFKGGWIYLSTMYFLGVYDCFANTLWQDKVKMVGSTDR
jgi:hypothetical protein